jgi:hypothetical protein
MLPGRIRYIERSGGLIASQHFASDPLWEENFLASLRCARGKPFETQGEPLGMTNESSVSITGSNTNSIICRNPG